MKEIYQETYEFKSKNVYFKHLVKKQKVGKSYKLKQKQTEVNIVIQLDRQIKVAIVNVTESGKIL